MKKLLAYLLVFCMVFSLLPITASAAEVASGTCGDDLTWTLDEDGQLTISGTGAMTDYDNLYSYAPWYSHRSEIIRVWVQEGVTSLSDYAFYALPNLFDITLPESLERIGDVALGGTALEYVYIPSGVTELGNETFSGCSKLTYISVSKDNQVYSCDDSGVLFNKDKTQLIRGPQTLEGVYVIPGTVELVAEKAFESCQSLTEVTIPGSVKELGRHAFASCTALETVHLQEGLEIINKEVFLICSALTGSLTIPASVTELGDSAFDMTELTEIRFLGDMPEISDYAFAGVALTVYYPADNVTWTEEKIEACKGLATWIAYDPMEEAASGTWGDNISWKLTVDGTLIVSGEGEAENGWAEEYPWYPYAEQIHKVIFEVGVTNVPEMAFNYYYPNLYSAELKGVEVVGNSAFTQCYALTDVTLPDTLKEIETSAFIYTGITSIEIPAGVTKIGSGAFSDTPLTEIVLPEGLTSIGSDAFMFCTSLKTVVLPDSLTSWDMLVFGYCTALESINIPAGVTNIRESAFTGCESLKSIQIPGNIKAIYSSAFADSGLEEIVFLGDAPAIRDSSFENVTATAYYPADNATWTEDMFQNYGGTITWVPYESEVYTIKWISGSTSMNGTIDLNVYVALSENLLDEEDAFVRFAYAGKTVDVTMAEAQHRPTEKYPNRYRFSCPMYAKQLADEVTVTVMKGDEMIGTELNYSVETYCKNRIEDSTDAAEVAMCKALLNYGAAAQQLLNYNTENPANVRLSDEDKILKDVDASAYKYVISGSEAGIKAKSATLMYEDVVKVRVYFILTGDKTIDEYTFTIDGKEVAVNQNSKGYYVETDGIAAKDLEKMFTVQVCGITVNYGALSYVNSKVTSSKTSETEKNLAKALYIYWQTAENFLE